MLRTGRSLPPMRLSTLRFDARRFHPTPAVCYQAPWRLPGPDFHRLADASLRLRDHLPILTTSFSDRVPTGHAVHVEPTTPLVHRLHGNHLLSSIGGGGMAAAQSKTFPCVLLPPMAVRHHFGAYQPPAHVNFRAPLHQGGSRALPRHHGQLHPPAVTHRGNRVILPPPSGGQKFPFCGGLLLALEGGEQGSAWRQDSAP